jgi:hypothetical protein
LTVGLGSRRLSSLSNKLTAFARSVGDDVASYANGETVETKGFFTSFWGFRDSRGS